MKEYTAGFLFDKAGQVLLIEKQRPAWQAGRYNGIGGEVEIFESPMQCMRREFLEETGLDIEEWYHFATLGDLDGEKFCVHFYYGYTENLHQLDVNSMTDEIVSVFQIEHLPDVLPNLRWLIPMAKSMDQGERASRFIVMEQYNAEAPSRS